MTEKDAVHDEKIAAYEKVQQEYIENLFKFVLRRDKVSSDEIAAWMAFYRANPDPLVVFNKFIGSGEHKQFISRDADNRTEFPGGHFYSPVVSRNEIQKDAIRIWAARVPAAVDICDGLQAQIFDQIKKYIMEIPFTDEKTEKFRYYYHNTSFTFGDAAVYWGMISKFKPSRIVEIGSGFSSALALDAIDHLGLSTRCTFIDPYPQLLKKSRKPIVLLSRDYRTEGARMPKRHFLGA